jgi:hypothetical protein
MGVTLPSILESALFDRIAHNTLRDFADSVHVRTIDDRSQLHMAYDPTYPYRDEVSRHLNMRARAIVGASAFVGY